MNAEKETGRCQVSVQILQFYVYFLDIVVVCIFYRYFSIYRIKTSCPSVACASTLRCYHGMGTFIGISSSESWETSSSSLTCILLLIWHACRGCCLLLQDLLQSEVIRTCFVHHWFILNRAKHQDTEAASAAASVCPLDKLMRKAHSSHPFHCLLSSHWSSFTYHCSL